MYDNDVWRCGDVRTRVMPCGDEPAAPLHFLGFPAGQHLEQHVCCHEHDVRHEVVAAESHGASLPAAHGEGLRAVVGIKRNDGEGKR